MPWTENPWRAEAKILGYDGEHDMLRDLYENQCFSIKQIAIILSKSSGSVRERLIALGVTMRARGGPGPRLGRRKLAACSDVELVKESVASLCEKYGVHASTISAERRLRKEVNVLCTDSSGDMAPENRGSDAIGTETGSTTSASSVGEVGEVSQSDADSQSEGSDADSR